MNAKTLIAIASVAAAFSGVARAGEADLVVDFSKFDSNRTRAEVQAEAVAAARDGRSGEAELVASFGGFESTRTRAEVQVEAAAAAKSGRSGEADALLAGAPDAGVSSALRVVAEPLQARAVQISPVHAGL